MAIKKSMARNFLLLYYHAFVAIHPLIAVTFSTPTSGYANYGRNLDRIPPFEYNGCIMNRVIIGCILILMCISAVSADS